MKRTAPLLVFITVLTGAPFSQAQEIAREGFPELPDLTPIPETLSLPTNLFLYNYKVSLLPAERNIFDAEVFSLFDRPFIPTGRGGRAISSAGISPAGHPLPIRPWPTAALWSSP